MKRKKCIFFLFLLLFTLFINSQNKVERYTIGEIKVSGNTSFSPLTIITFSGLREGDAISIPGERISNAIKKLWGSNLFSSVNIYKNQIEDEIINLEIELYDLPELAELKIDGVKKRKIDEIIKENKLQTGVKVTENLITTTKNYLENKFKNKGFLNAKVLIKTQVVEDSTNKSKVKMSIDIVKGNKIKINTIKFNGANQLKVKSLEKAMKNTKRKKFYRIFKRSKYVPQDFKEDLVSIVDKYKENGFRDARIISDTIYSELDKKIDVEISLIEGSKYTFGDINYLGNSVYTDQQLNQILKIKKGDTYNGIELEKRIADRSNPDANDLSNLYQNNGYLFSSITPVEVNADGNIIDLEIRINEGKPAYFNKISVIGNNKTNDHVIYREIRTRPGQLYSKANVFRSLRELGQLGFFDPQLISPDFKNINPNDGTVDLEYTLVETGSSQIELQGGYGGGGFIGTIGLSFNNFSIKDIFKKEAYTPIPMGDGQRLALRLQASRFYTVNSFNFTEPWLGGKKPVQFSVQLSQTKQFMFNPYNYTADKSRYFNISGLSVGLAKRLTVPDDYFTLSQFIGYQFYDLNDYNTGLFTFGNGSSNNLSYTVALSRNNTFTDPIYPTGGSNFTISAKLTFPYSAFNKVDYQSLKNERQDLVDQLANDPSNTSAGERIAEIDQERYKWLEFYKIKFKGEWFTALTKKLVLRPSFEFGFLGAYNNDRGVIPFERFFLGGDGMGMYNLDGRENIPLRGYPNQSLSAQDGGSIYNKYSLELRYPISLGEQAKIYALTFLEGGSSYNNFRDFDPFLLKRSAGIGVRLFMPQFGLLGIDFGHGFDPIPGQSTKHGWETHFIFGQNF
ncbi:MAG: outer membrane protein assembly factor BamA [Flavobacteriaceae bacterium]|nr:outer membrane protein assembly factor BamA [Flavobacteriaceae bacterium]|tara:strand:- start:3606 stop:6152 length:2547 start_codon:yes stop_codon:yes gene_type:complete